MSRLLRAGCLATLLAVLAAPAAVQAAELTGGCTLAVRSYDTDGNLLDDATGSNQAPGGTLGTITNPFRVDWNGHVEFELGTGGATFADPSWQFQLDNVPLPIHSGSNAAPLGGNVPGAAQIGTKLPEIARFAGLVYVTGSLIGDGGSSRCDGSAWVRVIGDPIGTMAFWVMIVLLLIGGILLVVTPYTVSWEGAGYGAMPRMAIYGWEEQSVKVIHRHWFRGIIGGLILGLGFALASILFATTLLGIWSSWLLVGLGLLIGILLVPLPSIRGGRRKPPPYVSSGTYGVR